MRSTLGPFSQLTDAELLVLRTYANRERTARAASNEFDGWLNRIDRLGALEPEQLTRAHGLLIAEGLIRFELVGRNDGLKYQLSPAGHRTLLQSTASADDESDDDTESDFSD